MARPIKMKQSIPNVTLITVGLSLIIFNFPDISDVLIYDRQEILSGEIWRIFTAPLVHFSINHMFWNLLVFGIVGSIIEALDYRGLWIVVGFGTIVPGLVFLLTSPELSQYGGLSGLATGVVVYFCFYNIVRTNKNRMIWIAILEFSVIKIFIELETSTTLFVDTHNTSFKVLPSVHVFGFLGAVIAIAWTCGAYRRSSRVF